MLAKPASDFSISGSHFAIPGGLVFNSFLTQNGKGPKGLVFLHSRGIEELSFLQVRFVGALVSGAQSASVYTLH